MTTSDDTDLTRRNTIAAGQADAEQEDEGQEEAGDAGEQVDEGQTAERVADMATQRGALTLNRLTLIGISGKPSEFKALVRLGDGTVVQLETGTRVEDGVVSGITEDTVSILRGQTVSLLSLPKS